MSDQVSSQELIQLIERIEHLLVEKQDITDQVKEVYAEAKGRGYNTKAIRQLVKIRKMDPEDRAEQEAIIEMYASAIGI